MEELIEKFDLSRVHKAGAKFDPEKNKWFNQHYLKMQSDADLAKEFSVILQEKGLDFDEQYTQKVVSLIKERATFVSDFFELSDFFFVAPSSFDPKALKNWKAETPDVLNQVASVIDSIDDFTAANIETTIKQWINDQGIGMGKVMQPLRISLVGALKGPDLFEIIELIGKKQTVDRIQFAIENIQ